MKAATLKALSNMPIRAARSAARKIIGHLDGIEFGIEYLSLPTGVEVSYVNTGDTYSATLLHVDGEWIYSSWGDVLEEAEADYAGSSGETLCPNCGEWTDWYNKRPSVINMFPHCGSCGYDDDDDK